MVARKAMAGRQPFQGGLHVSVEFCMPRPQRLNWKTRPMPREAHISTPDLDNLLKSLFDALTGIVWKDDGQIQAVEAVKVIAAGDEAAYVRCEVFPI